MDDSEFVRSIAVEFKRRGYSVAIQLRPLEEQPPSSKDNAPGGGGGEDGGGDDDDGAIQSKVDDDGIIEGSKTKKKPSNNNNNSTKPKLLPLPNFPFYPSTTSISAKKAEAWNRSYSLLRTYHAENCGALPSSTTTTTTTTTTAAVENDRDRDHPHDQKQKYPALEKWAKTQLALWKRMKRDGKHNLSLERISKLHSLNLETMERGAQQQQQQLSSSSSSPADTAESGTGESGSGELGSGELLSGGGGKKERDGGKKSNKHSNNNNNNSQGSKQSNNMQNILRNKEEGDEMTNVLLMSSSLNEGKNTKKWQEKFERLKRYKEEHGHTNVPRSVDNTLSKWCNTQRKRCKELLKGDAKTPMTRTQFQALESIGFEIHRDRKQNRELIDRKWEEKFNELLQYREKFGNTDVAIRKGFEAYKPLASWAGLQRRKYKAKQQGTRAGRSPEITEEQIKKLASVGFSFSLQDDFETRFKHLVEFKKEFGHTKVPVFYTGYRNLGRWAKRMRDGIRCDEPYVDEVMKARLLGIDFDIAARHVFGHKPKKKTEEEEAHDAAVEVAEMVDMADMGEMGGDEHQHQHDDEVDDMGLAEMGEPVDAQEVAAATAMAHMDNMDIRPSLPPFGNTLGGPHFFYHDKYHGYPHAQP